LKLKTTKAIAIFQISPKTYTQNKTSAARAEVKEESSEIPKCQIFFELS
jgi:hypothetical protein